MRVIKPNDLSILSTSVSETDAADGVVWAAGTTYQHGTRVRHNHITYESLLDGNKGNNPADTMSGIDAKWKKVGVTTPYKMLDEFVETQTIAEGALSFCVPYNRADAFSLLNVTGMSARIRIYDFDEPADSQLVYDETVGLIEDIFHLSLWEYNYLPITNILNFTQTELPQVLNGRLCVDISAAQDISAIGHIVVGRAHQLGYTQYGAELQFTDYSRETVDEFGVATLVRRSYTHRASLPIYLHPDQQDYVIEILSSLRGIPALWIGDNSEQGHSSFTVYGWLEDYRMVCEGPNENQLSLEIQGLI